jgi:dihydroflavonol-4-reductase
VTKRAAERVVLDEVGRGLHAVIVNPAFMLGPWDWKPSSGKMLLEVTRFAPFAPLGSTSICDARDVAVGAIAAAERGTPGQRYILAGYNLSYWEAWKKMAALAGKRGPRLPMGPIVRGIGWPLLALKSRLATEGDANTATMAMGRQSHCFSSERAKRELGYRNRPLEETLADTWTWFLEQGYVMHGGVRRRSPG